MAEEWKSVEDLGPEDPPHEMTWDPSDGPLHLKVNGSKLIVKFKPQGIVVGPEYLTGLMGELSRKRGRWGIVRPERDWRGPPSA